MTSEAMDNANLVEELREATRGLAQRDGEWVEHQQVIPADGEALDAAQLMDTAATALASANDMNERLAAGVEQAIANLGDAADRMFKIGKCLSEVSDKLGGDAGFESSATQVLAAAAIVRQYEADARALLQSNKGDGSNG